MTLWTGGERLMFRHQAGPGVVLWEIAWCCARVAWGGARGWRWFAFCLLD
jgi:hypothetical protein